MTSDENLVRGAALSYLNKGHLHAAPARHIGSLSSLILVPTPILVTPLALPYFICTSSA